MVGWGAYCSGRLGRLGRLGLRTRASQPHRDMAAGVGVQKVGVARENRERIEAERVQVKLGFLNRYLTRPVPSAAFPGSGFDEAQRGPRREQVLKGRKGRTRAVESRAAARGERTPSWEWRRNRQETKSLDCRRLGSWAQPGEASRGW